MRRGVCQDFAHIQIACLRALGLPARYVSGYLLTRPPAGKERLVGADASHAWLAVWVPGHDWIDLDPTNDVIPGREHITIAWGRDYGDVSPVQRRDVRRRRPQGDRRCGRDPAGAIARTLATLAVARLRAQHGRFRLGADAPIDGDRRRGGGSPWQGIGSR